MKKLLLILLCLPLLFATCKKEEEVTPTNTNNTGNNNTGNNTELIIGQWKLNYMETDMSPIDINEIWNDYNGTMYAGYNFNFYHLEFSPDLQVQSYEPGDGDGLVTNACCGTWWMSGDDLYINDFYTDVIYTSLDDLGRPFKIDLLNNNNLHLIEVFTNAQENCYGENRYFFERL